MQTAFLILHVFVALGLIGLVLIQHGKGADAGAAFGSGASSTVFGARGSASFLTRATGGLATLFFLTSMALGYFASQSGQEPGLMETQVETRPGPSIPIPEPISEIPPAPSVGGPAVPASVPVSPTSEVPVPMPAEMPEPAKAAE